jgi:hypothetical protein
VDDQGQPITRNIEDIRVGDLVLAKDQDDGSDDAQLRAVTAVSVRTSDHVRVLVIQDSEGNVETLRTTDEHPFFITNLIPEAEAGATSGASGVGGWVSADQLRAGDTLSGLDGESVFTVLSSTREERPQGILVYNLTVEGDHTYFVADSEGQAYAVWAHNARVCPTVNYALGMLREARVRKRLEARYGKENVLSQRTLLDAKGKKVSAFNEVKKKNTGRRVDFVVLDKDGNVKYVVEVTGKNVDKSKQMDHEDLVIAAGGTCIRNKATGKLLTIVGAPRKVVKVR